MTKEEKAKRYDEALKQIKECTPDENGFITIYPQEIFPELKESEDEKIRKELLEHCKNQAEPYIRTGNKCPQIQSWIAWLEKQGKTIDALTPQEAMDIAVGKCFEQGEQKPVDVRTTGYWHVENVKQKWSEEDEKNLLEIKCLIGSYRAGADEYRLDLWIDSLKNRVQPKQKWGEEDEEMFKQVIEDIVRLAGPYVCYNKDVDWLKSIREKIKVE